MYVCMYVYIYSMYIYTYIYIYIIHTHTHTGLHRTGHAEVNEDEGGRQVTTNAQKCSLVDFFIYFQRTRWRQMLNSTLFFFFSKRARALTFENEAVGETLACTGTHSQKST